MRYVTPHDKCWFGVEIIDSSSDFRGGHAGVNDPPSHPETRELLVNYPKAKLSQLGLVSWSIIFPYLKKTEHEYECC